MSDMTEIEWPREIWAFAIDYSEFETSGTYATSQFATIPRWEGDSERERPVQRYVDGDVYDSADRYWRERVETLEAKLAEAERRGAERMRERAARELAHHLTFEEDVALSEIWQEAIRALPLTEGGAP